MWCFVPLIMKHLELACLVSSEPDLLSWKARLGHALSALKLVPSCMLDVHNHLVIHEPQHEF